MAKTIVVGLDGANWPMIQPWIDEGILPYLKNLQENGLWGESVSCLPVITCPNWKCYSTGKNPGKLGVYRWDRIDTKNRRFILYNAYSFKSRDMWDYMNDAGLKTGIINMPTTYPPKPVKGFMISGGPDASGGELRQNRNMNYVYPPKLQHYLEGQYGYKVHPEPMIDSRDASDAVIDAILKLTELRFEVGKHLLKKEELDFLHITCFYSQALQHFFWRGEPVRRVWEMIDNKIGEILNDNGNNIIIMSDHGCTKVETNFFINVWLQQNGYLHLKNTIDNYLHKIGITRERVLHFSNRLKITSFLSKAVPQSLQRIVPWQEGMRKSRVFEKIVWDKTKAVASTLGPIYINLDSNDPQYESIRNELIGKLESLKCPYSNLKIFEKVYRREEIYSGPYVNLAPDLVALHTNGVHVSDSIGKKDSFDRKGAWEADNILKGMVLFYGSDVRKGRLSEECSIMDLAPTILHMMGVPIPEDMDGKILDIFEHHSELAKREKEYQKPKDTLGVESLDREDEEVASRLRSLGYID